MTKEAMQEEFEKWVGDRFDITPEVDTSIFTYLTAYTEGAWRAYQQGRIDERKSYDAELQALKDELAKYKNAEPVGWKDTMRTDYVNGKVELEPCLLGYEGWEKLPDGTELFTHPEGETK